MNQHRCDALDGHLPVGMLVRRRHHYPVRALWGVTTITVCPRGAKWRGGGWGRKGKSTSASMERSVGQEQGGRSPSQRAPDAATKRQPKKRSVGGSSPSVGDAGQTTRSANSDTAAAIAVTIARKDGRPRRPTNGAPTPLCNAASGGTQGGRGGARRESSGPRRGGGAAAAGYRTDDARHRAAWWHGPAGKGGHHPAAPLKERMPARPARPRRHHRARHRDVANASLPSPPRVQRNGWTVPPPPP